MRIVKLAGALILVLAFTAIGTASASAAETLWTWLPGATGTQFTGKSKTASLQIKGGGTITCQESSILAKEGEITGEQTLGLFTIHFGTKCTVAGLPANSLGDASGIILVHVHVHNCLISANDLGLLFKVLPLHLEVPSTKLLIEVEGSFVGLVSPVGKTTKTYTLTIAQTGGKQSIEKCEGGTAQTLLSSLDGGAFVQSGEEAKEGTLEWTTVEQEAMA